ncbi:MmyB family transcriptional regulator [Jiangella endophytica]|uniref:MmyB family transcriptional regulator n=1 Tax=Jiangella endophytica TaxID=1623398 RepID=UPI000E35120D|nr:hypothetical protein [Jiangella endophytica]
MEQWLPNPARVRDRYWRIRGENEATRGLSPADRRGRSCLHAFDRTTGLRDRVHKLRDDSVELAAPWKNQEVSESLHGIKEIEHPAAGVLSLRLTTMQVIGHPGLRQVLLTPAEETGTLNRLLGVAGAGPAL